MAHMSIPEKIGQLYQAFSHVDKLDEHRTRKPGSFIGALGHEAQQFQDALREDLPPLFGIDAIHGHGLATGATIFPIPLAMACSWNPELVREACRATAREMTATGANWNYSPMLDLARDLRSGRIEETFGEDPMLVGEMGAAVVRGYQGDDLSAPDSVLACAKHFVGYSETQGMWDASECSLSRRALLQFFVPPFADVLRAGCLSVMTAYQAVDGTPCSVNQWLLKDVLRRKLRFEGFVVSDFNNIGQLVTGQRVCADLKEAAALAVKAGNDIIMATPDFPKAAMQAVEAGVLHETDIDACCRRILATKVKLGLFESRRTRQYDPAHAMAILGCDAHRGLALRLATESIVLLKNDGTLPLSATRTRRIALVGPHADDVTRQFGGWTHLCAPPSDKPEHRHMVQPREVQSSPLDGLRSLLGDAVEIAHCKGADAVDDAYDDIASAVAMARSADVVVVVVGDSNKLSGEGMPRTGLELCGRQRELVAALRATGTPLVIVLVASKPLAITEIRDSANALLCAFCPGSLTGDALAAILFGKANPSGRLCISFPQNSGQIPCYYYYHPGWHSERYCDLPKDRQDALYPFGFGLSYTTFACAPPHIANPTLRRGKPLVVTVDVTNTGARAGTETMQLYVRDCVASTTQPNKLLKAFARVTLAAGQTRTVRLRVPFRKLAILNAQEKWVVEPGDFEALIGPNSADAALQRASFAVAAE